MSRIFHPLLYILACATRREMARQIAFLKVENEILRSKLPKRITVTSTERRRLVRAGTGLGKAIRELVTIVKPATFLRWLHAGSLKRPLGQSKPGRRRTPDDVCALILRLAQENNWGYTRILGELRKLGIKSRARRSKTFSKRTALTLVRSEAKARGTSSSRSMPPPSGSATFSRTGP